MFFRNGVFLVKLKNGTSGVNSQRWLKYVYLGFTFTTVMSTTQSSKQLALKGKRTTFDMVRALNKLAAVKKEYF